MFFLLFDNYTFIMGFPHSSDGKESACKAGDPNLIPGSGRSPGEGKRLPTPVYWPGEFHGLYSPWGHKESDTTERLSLTSFHFTFIITGKSRLKFKVVVILTQLYPINTYPLDIHNVNYITFKNQVQDS